MAIQIEPKTQTPFWVNALFYLSLALMVFSTAAFFVLGDIQKKAQVRIEELNDQLAKSKTAQEIALENYQNKINDFKFLIDEYNTNLNAIDFIEKNIHPASQITNISISAKDKTISFSGQANSFQTIGQQLIIFKGSNLVSFVELTGMSFGEGGKITFSFELMLDNSLFKK